MVGEGHRAGFEDASEFTDITGNRLGFRVNQRGNPLQRTPAKGFSIAMLPMRWPPLKSR
jgi:hypothetical protein